MILKEKNFKESESPKLRAGEAAEKQMAFYLQRSLSNIDDCYVMNDLRLEHKNNIAQIDHLVVSQYGIFIIESKSVYGKITVNEQLEWSRSSNNEVKGMASPVLQARAQADLIKKILIHHKDELRKKVLFGTVQKGFNYCPIIIYVAISDSGIIERKVKVTELFKADQIPSILLEKLSVLKKNNSLLSSSLEVWKMDPQETSVVANFLYRLHKPKISTQDSLEKVSKTEVSNSSTFAENQNCPKCSSGKLLLRKAKTEFFGCSEYPKCKFTSYR